MTPAVDETQQPSVKSATEDHPLGGPDDAVQQGQLRAIGPRGTQNQRQTSATQRANYFDLKDLTQKLERAHTDARTQAAAQEREAGAVTSTAAQSITGGEDASDTASSEEESDREDTGLFGESSKTPYSVLSPRPTSPRPSSRASRQPQLVVSGSYSATATPRRRTSRGARSVRDATLSPALFDCVNDSAFSHGTVVQHQDFGDEESDGGSPKGLKWHTHLLASLHLMSDAHVEQYLGTDKLGSSSELPGRQSSLSPSPLGRSNELRHNSDVLDTFESLRRSPSPSRHPIGRSRYTLVRATSAALSQALEDASSVKAEMRDLTAVYESQLEMQKRHYEDREEALRELCRQHGISDGAVVRCLTRATTLETNVTAKTILKSVETATEQRSTSALAVVPSTHMQESSEDRNLSHSLQEAMSDIFGDELSESGLRGPNKAGPRRASPSPSEKTSRSASSAPLARRSKPATAGATASSASLTTAGLSDPPSTPKPSSRLSPRSRSKSMSVSALSHSGSAASQTAGISGWLMPWSKAGSSKAAAVVATTPEAVTAEEYTSADLRSSDGIASTDEDSNFPQAPDTPTNPAKRRHERSASSSAASTIVTTAKSNSSSVGGLSLLGTLAWRRKKPVLSLSDDPIFDSQLAAAPRSHSPRSEGSRRSGVLLASDGASPASQSSAINPELSGETGTVPELHPGSRSASITFALDEVLRSPLISPAAERLHNHLEAPNPVPSHFRAIFLATRIMTSDPTSIVYDSGSRTSSAIAQLALSLVGRAREEGKIVAEPTKSAETRLSAPAPAVKVTAKPTATTVKVATTKASAATSTFGRAFGRYTSSAAGISTTPVVEPNVTRLPNLYHYSSPARGVVPVNTSQRDAQQFQKDTAPESTAAAPKSVELEAIIPVDSKPPTLALFSKRRSMLVQTNHHLARTSTTPQSLERLDEESSGDEFEVYGGKGTMHGAPAPVNEREHDVSELLTDRYGFVYDATPADVRLLKQARKAATPAPACLTGIRVGVKAKGADSDGPSDLDERADDEDSDIDKATTLDPTDSLASHAHSDVSETKGMSEYDENTLSDHESLHSVAGTSRKGDPARQLLVPRPSKTVAAATSVSVPSQSSTSSGPTSPSQEKTYFFGADDARDTTLRATKAAPSTSQTVRSLLGQLQTMHDVQQASQQAEWDVFIQRRMEKTSRDATLGAAGSASARKSHKNNPSVNGLSSVDAHLEQMKHPEEEGGRGLVGINTMGDTKTGKEDWKEFLRLCQSGVPLCYRAKLWVECSGANEVAEPGKYLELLKEHEGEVNQCTTQIDLDVHRTMPTNIYFGGDGPGVPKLRRVLVAYSWYNPECGYCQGMNNLAATLLLTHEREEEAFWVLVCMIEKILPSEYYTAHLLVSQADQRVLIDLVAELMPDLSHHIDELGVDLPAVTFAWFLSLYTDCLPVETLFRVWDILFVEGMATLFRVALAMLTINERELLATTSPAAFYGHVHSMTSRFFAVDRLIRLACGQMKRDIRYSDILGRREKHVRDLERELGLVVETTATA